MTDTIITVEGRFDAHHPAERGTVRISAGFQGPERGPVVARTTALHGQLAHAAQQLTTQGAVTWWAADRLQAWSERPWNSDGKQLPLVHHASVLLEVKFADFSALARWTEEIAVQDGVTVTGIGWALTEATKHRVTAEAQHNCVRDAVDRATAYARSLGLETVRAVALADPGMLGDETRPTTADGSAKMSRASAPAAASGGLDLKPEDITVSARVHGRFVAS